MLAVNVWVPSLRGESICLSIDGKESKESYVSIFLNLDGRELSKS